MGKFRDGASATSEAVTLVLATIDRIKLILESLKRDQREPDGADADLIGELERMVAKVVTPAPPAEELPQYTVGTLAPQVLERPLRLGEVSLDDLERAFRETPADPPPVKPTKPAPAEPAAKEVGKEFVKDDDAAKSG